MLWMADIFPTKTFDWVTFFVQSGQSTQLVSINRLQAKRKQYFGTRYIDLWWWWGFLGHSKMWCTALMRERENPPSLSFVQDNFEPKTYLATAAFRISHGPWMLSCKICADYKYYTYDQHHLNMLNCIASWLSIGKVFPPWYVCITFLSGSGALKCWRDKFVASPN